MVRLKANNQKLTKLCKALKTKAVNSIAMYKAKPLKQTTAATTNRSLVDEGTLPGESILDPTLDDELQSEEDPDETAAKEKSAV